MEQASPVRQEILEALALHRDHQKELFPMMDRLQPDLEAVKNRFIVDEKADLSGLSESEIHAVRAALVFATACFRVWEYSELLESTCDSNRTSKES